MVLKSVHIKAVTVSYGIEIKKVAVLRIGKSKSKGAVYAGVFVYFLGGLAISILLIINNKKIQCDRLTLLQKTPQKCKNPDVGSGLAFLHFV